MKNGQNSFQRVCITKIAGAMSFVFAKIVAFIREKKKAHEPFMWINVRSKLRGRLVRETALGICLSPAEILNLCEVVLSKIALYCDCLEFGDTEVVLFWMLTIFVSFYLYCIYLDAIFRFFFPEPFMGKAVPTVQPSKHTACGVKASPAPVCWLVSRDF